MRKFLPVIIFAVGVLVVASAFFILKGRKQQETPEEETAPEIPFEQRPFTSLTPSEDGHWLKLGVSNIKIAASTMDYELLYSLPDGRTQGVPGNITLSGKSEIDRNLLLGSESSGKFRYDEGVERGTLTLKFRDDKGKLIGKLSDQFHLQAADGKLTSVDGVFSYELDKAPKEGFFVTMSTFGVLGDIPKSIDKGPYAVFSSVSDELSGKVSLTGANIYTYASGSWEKCEGGKAENIGVFISSSE